MHHRIPAAAVIAAAFATPAIAQGSYGNMAPPPPSSQTVNVDANQAAPAKPIAPQPKEAISPSKQARKALFELQTAVNANDVANIPAKIAAAQAVATTKEDKYLLGQMELKAAASSKNTAALADAVNVIASSGYAAAPELAKLYEVLGGEYYNAKQYDQAIAQFQRAATTDPNNPKYSLLIGETQMAAGNNAAAAAIFQKSIQASQAAGQKPSEDIYKRAVQAAYDGNAPAVTDLAKAWVAAYPSPDSWHNAIAIYRNRERPDVEGTLDLLRLLRQANALTAGDYALYASSAADQLNFNEAQAVIDEGLAANKFSASDPRFGQIIPPLRTKPKATAADLASASKTAASGMALLRIGDRYYALKDYSKAVDLYHQAMGKPGVDPNIANLHIGIALAAAGDKAGATAALKSVGGAQAGIAQYWLIYLQSHA